MNKGTKNLVLVLVSALSMNVSADTTDLQNEKSVEKIDFNHLIEEGNEKKQELTWKDAAKEEDKEESEPGISAAERKSVVDFIDVEVQAGKTPSVVGVDRRYNSVGEAKVVDIEKFDGVEGLQVKLIKKSGT